jgi:hypothetical protein
VPGDLGGVDAGCAQHSAVRRWSSARKGFGMASSVASERRVVAEAPAQDWGEWRWVGFWIFFMFNNYFFYYFISLIIFFFLYF